MWMIAQRIVAALGLLVLSPVLFVVLFLIWKQDWYSPFYVAERSGKEGVPFRMIKLRTMIVNADKTGVDSTANDDLRITPVGRFVRRYKLDEFAQLFNVVVGDMSLVGPRPNVVRETDLYTSLERRLLSVRPGITDLSSIVFADEGAILEGSGDPDIDYHQLIRPGKSLLGLFYIRNRSVLLDIRIVYLTVVGIFCRRCALDGVLAILKTRKADQQLIDIAKRDRPLVPLPPPGAQSLVTSRDGRVDTPADAKQTE